MTASNRLSAAYLTSRYRGGVCVHDKDGVSGRARSKKLAYCRRWEIGMLWACGILVGEGVGGRQRESNGIMVFTCCLGLVGGGGEVSRSRRRTRARASVAASVINANPYRRRDRMIYYNPLPDRGSSICRLRRRTFMHNHTPTLTNTIIRHTHKHTLTRILTRKRRVRQSSLVNAAFRAKILSSEDRPASL